MTNLYIILLFLVANRFFLIGPFWKQAGTFDTADIGNLIIIFSFCFFCIFSKRRKAWINPISILILSYLSIVFIHFWLAQMNYHQSFFDSLVAVRHQFYFLSFFVFCILLKDVRTITLTLDTLLIVSLLLLLLSAINYFGFTIFYHRWAEGHGLRSGVIRAFIPSMSLVTFSTLWAFTKWNLADKEKSALTTGATILFVLAHFFRQTRMRLIGLLLTMAGAILYRKKFKKMILLLFFFLLTFMVFEISMKENLITNNFVTAFENYTKRSGTWTPRFRQFKLDFNEFKKNPWFGNGLSAVRQHGPTWRQIKTEKISAKADLGYSSWLKFYGIIGMIWLFCFFAFQIVLARRTEKQRRTSTQKLAVFTLSYLFFILFTFITLNSFMSPPDILLLSLNAAIIIRISALSQGEKKNGSIVEIKSHAS